MDSEIFGRFKNLDSEFEEESSSSSFSFYPSSVSAKTNSSQNTNKKIVLDALSSCKSVTPIKKCSMLGKHEKITDDEEEKRKQADTDTVWYGKGDRNFAEKNKKKCTSTKRKFVYSKYVRKPAVSEESVSRDTSVFNECPPKSKAESIKSDSLDSNKTGTNIFKNKGVNSSSVDDFNKTKPVFKFSNEDKHLMKESKKSDKNLKFCNKEQNIDSGEKKNISDIFQVEDDPYVATLKSKKKENDKLAARTKSQSKSKKRQSMAKMAQYSQNIVDTSIGIKDESGDGDKSVKAIGRKPKKRKGKEDNDRKQPSMKQFLVVKDEDKKYISSLEDDCEYTPSIDDLLKLPERSDDGGKTMDEVLDELDNEIAIRKKKHEKEMAKIGTDIASEKKKQQERKERLRENAVFRDRLESEVSKGDIKKMFDKNLQYLREIESGVKESSRHEAFHKSSRTRHALYYTMITDPFTDDQLEWTLEEISKVWMRNKKERMENNEYVWKVILAECFIKFYMDHFNLDKCEAEQRIRETPLRNTKNESGDEDSSNEIDM